LFNHQEYIYNNAVVTNSLGCFSQWFLSILKKYLTGFVILFVCRFCYVVSVFICMFSWLIPHPIAAITNLRIHGMYVCMYVCMYMCVCARACVRVCMHACMLWAGWPGCDFRGFPIRCVKRPERAAEDVPPSGAEIKNMGIFTSRSF
jgi:hypothetical protein